MGVPAEFCAAWRMRQDVVMRQLQHALASDLQEEDLQRVVAAAEQLLASCYAAAVDDAAAAAAKPDVLQFISPPWQTPLEKAFLWLGGWRPSAAYLLVYALAGHQAEAELSKLLAGIDTPSLASLSAAQLSQISAMQVYTVEEEKLLQHHKALLQQSIAEQPIVGLAQALEKRKLAEDYGNGFLVREKHIEEMNRRHFNSTRHAGDRGNGKGHDLRHCRTHVDYDRSPDHTALDMQRKDRSPACADDGLQRVKPQNEQSGSGMCFVKSGHESKEGGQYQTVEGLLKCVVHEKLKRLEELSLRADSLRRRTLTGLLEVLHTVQCAQFLLASLQLQVAIRDVGEKMKQNP